MVVIARFVFFDCKDSESERTVVRPAAYSPSGTKHTVTRPRYRNPAPFLHARPTRRSVPKPPTAWQRTGRSRPAASAVPPLRSRTRKILAVQCFLPFPALGSLLRKKQQTSKASPTSPTPPRVPELPTFPISSYENPLIYKRNFMIEPQSDTQSATARPQPTDCLLYTSDAADEL